MFGISCVPKTYLVTFDKDSKKKAELLINVINDYLQDESLYHVKYCSMDMKKELAAAMCDLKFSPACGWTPRFSTSLPTLIVIEEIIKEYSERNNIDCFYLATGIHHIYESMVNVKC